LGDGGWWVGEGLVFAALGRVYARSGVGSVVCGRVVELTWLVAGERACMLWGLS
jgi:hypothetical protein